MMSKSTSPNSLSLVIGGEFPYAPCPYYSGNTLS